MAIYFVYRVNGGEVQTVSTSSQAGTLSSYFAETQDPTMPDGADLAVKKIFVGGTVRNATAGEITAFATAKATDDALIARAAQASFMDAGLNFIIYKATAQVVVDEINLLREWITSFKAAVAAATSLANLQSRVAALNDMPDRTYMQGKNAIKAAINSGVND